MRAVFMRKHIFVLLNIREKSWKVATEDFVLFILFGIGKKFSFPTFFQLRYCELVAWQLRVFAQCFHTNYIAWQLKLNHWFRSNQKTHSLISAGTPPLNSLKLKLHVYIFTIRDRDKFKPSQEFVDFVARSLVILDPSTPHISSLFLILQPLISLVPYENKIYNKILLTFFSPKTTYTALANYSHQPTSN